MLVAILLVALATIIAADIAYRNAMTARRGTATLAFDEALLAGQGAEAFAGYGLRTIMQMSGKTGTGTGTGATPDIYASQQWAQPYGPFELTPGMTLELSLEDMQGRFNLNWLVNYTQGANLGKPNQVMVDAFKTLLELAQVDPKWADMVVDWIDRDNLPQTQGAEDSAYLGQNPPYLAANQYITSTSELLALPGFGRDNYQKIAPYIAALPPGSMLNICTAKDKVLDAFTTGQVQFSQDQGQALQKNRADTDSCFPTKQTYLAGFPGGAAGASAGTGAAGASASQYFVTTSNYFRLSSLVTIGTTEFNLYSLLYVDNQYFIHPIQRSFSAD